MTNNMKRIISELDNFNLSDKEKEYIVSQLKDIKINRNEHLRVVNTCMMTDKFEAIYQVLLNERHVCYI